MGVCAFLEWRNPLHSVAAATEAHVLQLILKAIAPCYIYIKRNAQRVDENDLMCGNIPPKERKIFVCPGHGYLLDSVIFRHRKCKVHGVSQPVPPGVGVSLVLTSLLLVHLLHYPRCPPCCVLCWESSLHFQRLDQVMNHRRHSGCFVRKL